MMTLRLLDFVVIIGLMLLVAALMEDVRRGVERDQIQSVQQDRFALETRKLSDVIHSSVVCFLLTDVELLRLLECVTLSMLYFHPQNILQLLQRTTHLPIQLLLHLSMMMLYIPASVDLRT
jgi:hypothetical protein